MTRLGWIILPLLLALLAACGGDAVPAAPVDPSFDPSVEVFEVFEVATGVDRLSRLFDDQPIELVAGPQGGGRHFGFHIWLGVFSSEPAPANALDASFLVRDLESEEELGSAAYQVRLVDVDGGYGAWGMRAVLSDCCVTENRRIAVRLEANDADGGRRKAEMVLRTGECPRGLPDRTIDPCP